MILLAFLGLPDDSPFSRMCEILLAIVTANLILIVVVMVMVKRVLNVKKETRDLLQAVKEWTELGKEVRKDANIRGQRVERKVDENKEIVLQVPDRVLEKIEEKANKLPDPPSGEAPRSLS
jgi:uncharacterized membrane protein YvbJ